jgi:predicted nucleotidyltransferase
MVFGSRVRGDFRGDSDLDILIVVDKKNRAVKDAVLNIIYSYELQADISCAITVLSREEMKFNEKLGSPFLESIQKEGITVYDIERRGEESTFELSPR